MEALEEPTELAYAKVDELNELSNSVVDDIDSGDLDKAETTCRLLLERYFDQVDGLERLASVYEARGNYTKAADHYKQAVEFMESRPGFDREFINWTQKKAKEMEGRKGS